MLDLRDVDVLDSSALGVVVQVHRALPEGRRLLLVGARGMPLRALQLTGLDAVLEVVRPEQPLAPEVDADLALLACP